jgi:hypothetical protein
MTLMFKPSALHLDEVAKVGGYIYAMGSSYDDGDDPDYINGFTVDNLGNKVYDHQLTFYTDYGIYITEVLTSMYEYCGFINETRVTRISPTHVRVAFTTTDTVDPAKVEWVSQQIQPEIA